MDITAVADDADSGVDTVTFEYKLSTAATWTTCGVDTDAPYSCHLVTSSWPNGSYSFRSTATDLAGNTTTTATVTRTVDNTAPSVSISAPSAGAVITTGSTTVTADAFAVAGVTSVRIEARTGAGTFAADLHGHQRAVLLCVEHRRPGLRHLGPARGDDPRHRRAR